MARWIGILVLVWGMSGCAIGSGWVDGLSVRNLHKNYCPQMPLPVTNQERMDCAMMGGPQR